MVSVNAGTVLTGDGVVTGGVGAAVQPTTVNIDKV
jgi:hypothetical protein